MMGANGLGMELVEENSGWEGNREEFTAVCCHGARVSNANWRVNHARCIWDAFRGFDFMSLQGAWLLMLGAGKGMV